VGDWSCDCQSSRHARAVHMLHSRAALLACALLAVVAFVAAQDPCALPANVGRAWVGTPNQYVSCSFLSLVS